MSEQDHRLTHRETVAASSSTTGLIRKVVEQGLFTRMVAPMGIPTTIIADDRDLLDAASAACPSSPDSLRDPNKSILIRLTTARASPTGISCDIAVEGSRLRLQGPDFQGFADSSERLAECSVPRRLFNDFGALAAEITDTLLLFLLARSGRTPIHGAGLVAGDRALIASGPSGYGKSSLAFAWARRGLPVLSDDIVYVQVDRRLRIWGHPGPLHLYAEDARDAGQTVRHRNGKDKLAVPLAAWQCREVVEEVSVILLERGDRVSLDEIDTGLALDALMNLEPGFDLLPEESELAARMIVGSKAWRLTLGRHPDDAVDCLIERFAP